MTANQRKPTTSKDKDILATSKSKAVAKKTALVLRYIIPPLSLGLSRLYLPKPPAPHLFKSNTPPSDHEVNLIFAAITLAAQKQERIIDKVQQAHGGTWPPIGMDTCLHHLLPGYYVVHPPSTGRSFTTHIWLSNPSAAPFFCCGSSEGCFSSVLFLENERHFLFVTLGCATDCPPE